MLHSSWERGVRIRERNSSADTKVSEEGGGGGAPGAGAEIPLQPMVKTMVRQAVHLQPMEVNGGADIHLQPREVNGGADIHLQPVENAMPEQVDVPEGGYDPVKSPCQHRLLAGTVARGEEPVQEQVIWQGLWPVGEPMLELPVAEGLYPVERHHAGAVLEEEPMLEQFMKDCIPWERPHAGAREKHEEEGAEESNKFADDTKWQGVAERPKGCAAIQKDLNRLKKWVKTNLTKLNKGKCEVLYLERNKSTHQ
ncbi:hypothetical protein QYF61_018951 [Mycteria americana]|uniref:Uncharacterized protein n=1 Tax=Mycteria americana TaxID=33587 RepID=A0AAN7SL84_MYCAM|nr:hypothetical protein QYF61_018951 [Mycteria americana]